ncbi:peptidoglycan-binding domain-containing protein [Ralstonia sp. 24A2]|uniref:peptidoglycan-binding domain-containing protein n=1 Tax=Ralstonia sp. 24A2 TaxID=3447364 RepID=UPI003F695E08
MAYGNHDLRRGDHDGNTANNTPPKWGGVEDPPASPASAETPSQGGGSVAVLGHVEQLQRDLRELGFVLVGTPDGSFGRGTEWAVREFQIYASMARVAQLNRSRLHQMTNDPQTGEAAHEVAALGTAPNTDPPESFYVASLEQATNTARYTGPISGLVNERTRQAIAHWIGNGYRCPVVIEAWNIAHGQRTTTAANGVNIWRYNELPNSAPRMFYRDFSGYYPYPGTRDASQYQVLGTYSSYSTYGGPASLVPKHTWREEAEMTPESLIDAATTVATLQSNLTGATASTYRAVRAAAEQECMGAFDSVNAYDDALVSLGPCHWTMGIMPDGGYKNGELPGFLAYVLSKSRDDYLTAYGNFGLYPSDTWVGSNEGALWNAGQRKYAGWIRSHDDNVDPLQAPDNVAQLPLVDRDPAEANYYKNWHWFFRWVMAGRTIQTVRHSMWDMVRLRLRDVLGISVTVTSGSVTVNGTLGTIFTSEKAAAILLRWHIFRPAHVSGERVRNSIVAAIQANPTLSWSLAPAQWTNAHESALTARLLTDAAQVNATQTALANWPNYAGRADRNYVVGTELGSLSEARGSFVLDATGL